jgi:hypothetical protein
MTADLATKPRRYACTEFLRIMKQMRLRSSMYVRHSSYFTMDPNVPAVRLRKRKTVLIWSSTHFAPAMGVVLGESRIDGVWR